MGCVGVAHVDKTEPCMMRKQMNNISGKQKYLNLKTSLIIIFKTKNYIYVLSLTLKQPRVPSDLVTERNL